MTAVLCAALALAAPPAPPPELVEVRKVWSKAPHNGFTDLVRHGGEWFCLFREGLAHTSFDGTLRVIASKDGRRWASAAELTWPGADLREGEICTAPDGRLMVCGAVRFPPAAPGEKPRYRSAVWFSEDGRAWTKPAEVGDDHVWLWRVLWKGGEGYCVGYDTKANAFSRLYKATPPATFEPLGEPFFTKDRPNEAALAFRKDGSLVCLQRFEGPPGRASARVGVAKPPYADWAWKDLGVRVGGPAVTELPDGRLVAVVRLYGPHRTAVCELDPAAGTLTELLTLPSGGDCAYAGLVQHGGEVWASYYSSHDGHAGVYVARLRFPPVPRPALAVHALYSDGAVLQRGVPLPVCGTAEPGEPVAVTFAGETARATAGDDGRWTATLPAKPASATPAAMTVAGRGRSLTMKDLLVGEVWVCAGQSNMAWALARAEGGAKAIEASADPLLRLLPVPMTPELEPRRDLDGASWRAAGPETTVTFSGVGYFFGRDLRKALGVPVGLVQSTWGGTPAESWTSPDGLSRDPALAEVAASAHKTTAAWRASGPAYVARLEKYLASARLDAAAGRPLALPPQPPGRSSQAPAALFNGMVAPLAAAPVAGVAWYQGESNVPRAGAYKPLLAALVADWRRAWRRDDLPFLVVQIAPYARYAGKGGDAPSAVLREAQAAVVAATPHAALVVTTDVGDAYDIHPVKKEPVGARLARAARAVAYGEAVEHSGPVFRSLAIKGSRAEVAFAHAAGGLVARGGRPAGFEVAGADGAFAPADATIEGDRVVLTSAKVAAPAAVRFAWADAPAADLFNKTGLPAVPFRASAAP